jgi:hypothetical protein
MNSQVLKVTDDKDEHARRGWILYDAECALCAGLVTWPGANCTLEGSTTHLYRRLGFSSASASRLSNCSQKCEF